MIPGRQLYQIMFVVFSVSFLYGSYLALTNAESIFTYVFLVYLTFVLCAWFFVFREANWRHHIIPVSIVLMCPLFVFVMLTSGLGPLKPEFMQKAIFPITCLFFAIYCARLLRHPPESGNPMKPWALRLLVSLSVAIVVAMLLTVLMHDYIIEVILNVGVLIISTVILWASFHIEHKGSEIEQGVGLKDYLQQMGIKLQFSLLFALFAVLALLPLVGILDLLSWYLPYPLRAMISFPKTVPILVAYSALCCLLFVLCKKKRVYLVTFLISGPAVYLIAGPVHLFLAKFRLGITLSPGIASILALFLAFSVSWWIASIASRVAKDSYVTAIGVFLSTILAAVFAFTSRINISYTNHIKPMTGIPVQISIYDFSLVNVYIIELSALELFAGADIRKQARKFCEIETEVRLLEGNIGNKRLEK